MGDNLSNSGDILMSCRWLTVQQMAVHLQVSRRTIDRWIKDGKLTVMKIGSGPRPVTRICAKVPNTNIVLAEPINQYVRPEDARLVEELNKYPDTDLP